jgi:hypothetical protein
MAESAKSATDKVQPQVQEEKVAEPFSTTTKDAIDPITGEKYAHPKGQLGGRSGFDSDGGPVVGAVPSVDPKRIPADVSQGVSPDSGGDALLAAAQAAAPNLTREFVEAYELDDEVLAAIARREVPPPPTVGPIRSSDLYLTPGGWQNVPPGVRPEDVGKNAVHR